jgi:fructose-1,6-bisphosphatase
MLASSAVRLHSSAGVQFSRKEVHETRGAAPKRGIDLLAVVRVKAKQPQRVAIGDRANGKALLSIQRSRLSDPVPVLVIWDKYELSGEDGIHLGNPA